MILPEVRTRFPVRDFDAYHQRELPELLRAGRGAVAASDTAAIGHLAFRVPDDSGAEGASRSYTYIAEPSGIRVESGEAHADVVVELDDEIWSGLVDDLESAPGLLYGGLCRVVRGDPMRFVRWEPRLRAIYQGRPVYTGGVGETSPAELLDRRGGPLDPTLRFELDSDPEEMAHFLRETGYLVVRSVFSAAEIAAFREDAEALRNAAREGDQQSWWARDEGGKALLCRVIDAAKRPRFAALNQDARLLKLVSLSDHDLVARKRNDYEAVSVLWKNPGASEGLSDLPWHRDCGMGGHAVMCPVLIATVNLTAGNAESGELRMLPGSWQNSVPFFESSDPRAPEGVGLEVEPGDVSLHYGDVMHAAPPPTASGEGPYRTSVLLAFAPRDSIPHHRGAGGYNDVLLGNEDGQVEHLAKVADRNRLD